MINVALTNLKYYNRGDLVFEWVKLPCEDLESVFDRIGHDEYFISDYECEIPHMTIHEYDCVNKLNELAKQIEELNDHERKALLAIQEAHGLKIKETLEIVKNENYLFYEVDDFDELIDMYIEDGLFGDIPSNLTNCLDYEKIARDLQYDGYVQTAFGIINID